MNHSSLAYPDFIERKLNEIRKKGGIDTISDDHYTYILIATGERPTGGYDIQVVDAEIIDDTHRKQVLVKVKEIQPRPTDIVTQALTYPAVVYRIEKTNLPVKVRWVRTELG